MGQSKAPAETYTTIDCGYQPLNSHHGKWHGPVKSRQYTQLSSLHLREGNWKGCQLVIGDFTAHHTMIIHSNSLLAKVG